MYINTIAVAVTVSIDLLYCYHLHAEDTYRYSSMLRCVEILFKKPVTVPTRQSGLLYL